MRVRLHYLYVTSRTPVYTCDHRERAREKERSLDEYDVSPNFTDGVISLSSKDNRTAPICEGLLYL